MKAWVTWMAMFSAAWTASSVRPAVAAATNEPVVRMLVPGFSVQELPVRLSNQNNLRFAPDGTLTALGYDGRVWRLRDTDGDGLEDSAEPYWDRSTLSVPLGMAWSTAGLYVSSKGKVSLLRDTDADGRADVEEIVASGWPATDVGSGGVDATAVTLDRDGNVYFGLLGADYSNAYRLRKRRQLRPEEIEWLKRQGRWKEPSGLDSAIDEFSLYDLNSPRGTIQRFDPRTRELTTVATGLRVPVALAFNREGDLFNTDQEGETWMPNGNPLDELNHIVEGRNCGFPPRHERWLPDLMSDPPVVAFGPQHQSACGLVFNEPRKKSAAGPGEVRIPLPALPGQGLFGPEWWWGDALVAGESRGKIWRVRLVKTPHGYVGKSYPIARLSMLALDLAISPQGDLYVCCHSGPPDWGTGPHGEGKIFRISYTDRKTPQPVAVWPASPTEVRVLFDRPVDGKVIDAFARRITHATEPTGQAPTIEFGEYVSAGDRYEVLKPPYEVVQQQDATPRGHLAVRAARLEDGSGTLVLTTDPHPLSVTYSLSIPEILTDPADAASNGVQVEYDFHGVAVTYTRPGDSSLGPTPGFTWKGWLPYPTGSVGFPFISPATDRGRPLPGRSMGRLAYETTLSGSALVPLVILKGAEDPVFRPEDAFLRLELMGDRAADRLALRATEQLAITEGAANGFQGLLATIPNPGGRPVAASLNSWWLPWAPTNRASSGTDSRATHKPDGDWEHGRELFASPKVNCVKCHRVRGDGGTAGPDLSNLVHRDPTSVLRDIREPGATLHPDYVTYQAEMRDGSVTVGFLRASSDQTVRMFDAEGRESVLQRSDVTQLHPTGQSLMPTGLLDALSESDVRDLLTFLLHEPPTRARTGVEAMLLPTKTLARTNAGPFRVVLVASKQDHGPGQHDYPAWQGKWKRLLSAAGTNAIVETAWEWPDPALWNRADVVAFYFWNHDWSEARYAELDAYQQRGGGLVLIHSAIIADQDPERLAERIGLSAQPDRSGYRHMPFELTWMEPGNPLVRGIPDRMPFLDEPYWPLIGDPARVTTLASAMVDGASRPLMWTFERGRGRVFASIPGHYSWTLDDPFWRIVCLRGIAWAAGRDLMTLQDGALLEALTK